MICLHPAVRAAPSHTKAGHGDCQPPAAAANVDASDTLALAVIGVRLPGKLGAAAAALAAPVCILAVIAAPRKRKLPAAAIQIYAALGFELRPWTACLFPAGSVS